MQPPDPALAAPLPTGDEPVLVIEPKEGWTHLGLGELWRHRELLFFLVWRDLKVRYKQTVLGISWAILQPLMTMLIFTLIFSRVGKVPSDGVPYPIFSFTALVPWTLFSRGVAQSSASVLGSQSLLKKVYFPRLTLPISALLASLVDFALSFAILLVLMVIFGVLPTADVLWLPLLVLLAFATSLGAGLWLSALNVMFRDIRYAVPFLLQLLLFATPIAYPSSQLPEPWRTLVGLNPLSGVVEGFRWALLGVDTQPGPQILVSALVAAALCLSGLFFFRRAERRFADVV